MERGNEGPPLTPLFINTPVQRWVQVSLDDVFKWSPVVWLVGVIICGLVMNLFLQIRRFFKKRRAKRLREQVLIMQHILITGTMIEMSNSFSRTCSTP